MARGDMVSAEARFEEALVYDPDLFGAKNNLAIAYGLQRKYRVPLVTLSEEERAVILHNLGVIALRQGDREIGRGLLEQSLAVHPRHYAPAADKLAALGVIQ
jgi:Tfp pilus assembly protein PilF